MGVILQPTFLASVFMVFFTALYNIVLFLPVFIFNLLPFICFLNKYLHFVVSTQGTRLRIDVF